MYQLNESIQHHLTIVTIAATMKACRLFYSASSVSQVLPPQFQYALYWALILLDLAHYLSSASVCSIFVVLYVFFIEILTFRILPFAELSLVGLVLVLVD